MGRACMCIQWLLFAVHKEFVFVLILSAAELLLYGFAEFCNIILYTLQHYNINQTQLVT